MSDTATDEAMETALTAGKGRSLWADARRRFMKNRAAVASALVLALVLLFAAFGQFLAQWSNEDIDWTLLGQVPEAGGPSLSNGH